MRDIFAFALAGWALAAPVQACLVEDLPTPGDREQYDATMRALMLAHAPIEYRKSCGLRDASDERFFEAIRLGVNCQESEAYADFFGLFLSDTDSYLMAVTRTDLRSDDDYEKYCRIVDRIDLSVAVSENGRVDAKALQVQAPLFYALQELVATRRWQQ